MAPVTCRIHDGSLTRRLAEALLHATKVLIAERDCLYEGACVGSTGEVGDEDDVAMLADYDDDIDRALLLLTEAGYWPEVAPACDLSDPEHLPDWAGALEAIRHQIRIGDMERGALS